MTDNAFVVKNGLIVNTNVFIVDTGQNAAIVSNLLYVGNSSSNVFINSTSFSGTANAALSISGIAAANLVSNAQLQANLVHYEAQTSLITDVSTITSLSLQTLTPNNGGITSWIPANATSTMAQITLTANTTMGAPSGFANGTYLLFVNQSNGGNHKITWFANNWFWPAGVAPTLTTASGAIDILSFIQNSGIQNQGNVTMFGTYAPNFLG